MRHLVKTLAPLLLLGLGSVALSAPAPGQEPAQAQPEAPGRDSFFDRFVEDSEIALNFGTFGALDTEQVFEIGLELRLGHATLVDRLSVRPIIGTSILDDGGNYWYLGARAELPLDREEDWQLGLSFAPGVYSPGGIDLGGPVEFRSGIDLSYELFEDVRAGVGLFHLSNGGLYSRNGGAESALFSISAGL